MPYLRTTISCLLLSCSVIVSSQVASAQPTSLTPQQVERLTEMAELWSTVKYFHPYVAYRDINWDSAMVAVLPDVLDANDTAAYVSAIESLLSVLDDPATFVVESRTISTAPTDSFESVITWTADSILVATMNEKTLDPDDYVMMFDRLGALRNKLGEARGIVFDMRSKIGFKGLYSLEESFGYGVASLESALTATSLIAPGQRARIHDGYTQERGGIFKYSSAFYVKDRRYIEAGTRTELGPIVFLVNRYSQLPSVAVALQDAGLAAIVSDGPASDASLIGTHPLEMGDDISVQVRITELVHTDGTTGLGVNLLVPNSPNEEGRDRALEQALELARTFETEQVTRSELIPAAITRSGSYSNLYPSRPERALAAFKVWAVIKYFFPYYDLMDDNWDEVFRESLPGIVDAVDALSYHLAIAKMYARIQDSHGFMLSPILWRRFVNARSPIFLQWVEEQPVVVRFRDPEAAQEAGIDVGDVVLEIDGIPASERIDEVIDYFAASTPQALMRQVMSALLTGPDSSMVSLKLSGKNNQIKNAQIQRLRSYNPNRIPSRDGDVLQLLSGDIGYADLDRLMMPQVEEMFERFKDTRAIIFDMRGYPNGTAWEIAPYLAKKSEVDAAYYYRNLLLGPDEKSFQKYSFIEKIPPSIPGKHYDGLTVMLIDEHAQSQSEHSGLFFEAANGTVFIGSHTSGGNGDVTNFTVPGNIRLSFSGHSVTYPDGRQLQRLGLVPEVEVRPTIEGLRDGRDEVLEAALNYLDKVLPD